MLNNIKYTNIINITRKILMYIIKVQRLSKTQYEVE